MSTLLRRVRRRLEFLAVFAVLSSVVVAGLYLAGMVDLPWLPWSQQSIEARGHAKLAAAVKEGGDKLLWRAKKIATQYPGTPVATAALKVAEREEQKNLATWYIMDGKTPAEKVAIAAKRSAWSLESLRLKDVVDKEP